MTMDHIHRKKCIHQLEEAKLQKEIDDELMLSRSFKGKYFSNLNTMNQTDFELNHYLQ